MGENAPKVRINLDKPRVMQFTLGVAHRFKNLTGKEVKELNDDTPIEEVITLLWLSLQVEDKELTQEETEDILHMQNIQQYISALTWLVDKSTPEPEGAEAPKDLEIALTT